MRKLIITILALISLSVNAQDLHWDASGGHKQPKFGPSMRGFYYGPVAGINLSTITQLSYAQTRVRPVLGLMVGYQISNLIGVQAEALYSWEGAKLTNSDAKYTLNYFKVPIVAKLNIIGGLGVEAGISFEPLVHAALNNASEEDNDRFRDGVSKFDFTIPVGASFLIARQIEIGARYYIPCTKIFSNNDLKAANSTFSFTVKCRF